MVGFGKSIPTEAILEGDAIFDQISIRNGAIKESCSARETFCLPCANPVCQRYSPFGDMDAAGELNGHHGSLLINQNVNIYRFETNFFRKVENLNIFPD